MIGLLFLRMSAYYPRYMRCENRGEKKWAPPASRGGGVRGGRGGVMLTVHPEIVIDRNRKPKAVLLPYSEWNRVVADMEELEDIRAYDRAKARGDEAIPFEEAAKELKKKRSA